jgi:hypothetical protein
MFLALNLPFYGLNKNNLRQYMMACDILDLSGVDAEGSVLLGCCVV